MILRAGGWRGQKAGLGDWRGTEGRGLPIRQKRGQFTSILLQGWIKNRPRSERNSGGCLQKQLDFSGVQGFSLFGTLCFIPLYPAVFAASSFPGFKTALPKLMLRREVTTKVNLLIELFSNIEERVLIWCWRWLLLILPKESTLLMLTFLNLSLY